MENSYFFIGRSTQANQEAFETDSAIERFMEALSRSFQVHQLKLVAWACCASRVEFLVYGNYANLNKSLSRLFANHEKKQRRSQLWAKHQDCLSLSLNLLRYVCFIEHLPVRMYFAQSAQSYTWSSIHYHLGLRSPLFEDDSEAYLTLGSTHACRAKAYGEFLKHHSAQLIDVELCLNKMSNAL